MGKRRSDKIYGIPIAVIVVGVLWYFSGSRSKKTGGQQFAAGKIQSAWAAHRSRND